jgi:hypothetical protein
MNTRRNRNRGPVADNRLVQRPEDATVWKSPFSRNLGHTTGLGHHSSDSAGSESSELLKNDLSTPTDHSKREGSRPLGDLYADMQKMIGNAVSALAPSSGGSITAGTGLVATGGTFSVDSVLAHVVEVGALTGLTVNGPVVCNDTVSVPAPTAPSDAATKFYADSVVPVAGTGLTKTGNTLSVNGSAITALGTLTGLTVAGNAVINGILTNTKSFVSPMQYFAPASGDVLTSTGFSPGMIVNPVAALAALTIAFPGTPSNGQHFSVHSSQDVTALTVTAPFANGNAPAAITAGVPLRFVYSSDAAAWFRD